MGMAAEIKIRRLGVDDLDFADRVREQAGWNQTRDDWRRLLRLEPEGCFLAELDGQSAGTATTTVYGDNDLAWIGMVLVDESARRCGVGGALLARCISYLRDERQVKCIKLDATPAGQPLYEKLGFVAEWGIKRWRYTPGSTHEPLCDPSARAADPESLIDDERLALDRETFGADRGNLLRALAQDALMVRAEGTGFGMVRRGALANYLGPVVAEDWANASPLLVDLAAQAMLGGNPVIWDIPLHCVKAEVFAQKLGFRPERQLVRMVLDGVDLQENPQSVFAIAEPALG